jgi:hypothetical protein
MCCVFVFVFLFVFACMCVYVYVYVYVCMCVCVYVCMCVCVYAELCTCLNMCTTYTILSILSPPSFLQSFARVLPPGAHGPVAQHGDLL